MDSIELKIRQLHKRLFVFWVFVCLYSLQSLAQAVSFYATSDAKQIIDKTTVQLEFTLENAQGSGFRPPDFKGFRVISGPSRSSQTTIINGKRSQKMSLRYVLMPQKTGKLTIAEASIRAKGRTYKSKPITIEVITGKNKAIAGNGSSDEDFFVRLELSDSIAYIGQQIICEYVLYTNQDVHSADFLSESEYNGFFNTPIREYREASKRVVIDGRQYTKKALRTYALFPQQTGEFTFEEAVIALGIPLKNQRRSFFFTTQVRNEQVLTNAARILIKQPPQGAPSSFSGAIGKFSMRANVDKRSVTTDDAFTIHMSITGVGDGKFLSPPSQPLNENFDYYDPNVIKDETLERGKEILVVKQFEYLVVPKTKGQYQLRPEFSYFDTDSNKYITVYAGPIGINVIQGEGINKNLDTDESAKTLAPIYTTTRLRRKGQYFLYSKSFFAIASMPFLAFIAVLFIKRKQIQQANIDPATIRQSKAEKIAISRLSQAKSFLEQGQNRAFHDETNKALFGYLSDKYLIENAKLSKENIEKMLLEDGNPSEDVKGFMELISLNEMALFTGNNQLDMKSIYDDAVRAISRLELKNKNSEKT